MPMVLRIQAIKLPTDNNTELLIIIDSNGNHLNHRLFWTLDKTKWIRCGTINESSGAINKMKYTNLKYVLIGVGVNDIDDARGAEVATKMCNLIRSIHQSYPEVKIILNEITPRNDNRDNQVVECNAALQNVESRNEYVFLAKQSNLRDETFSFFHDHKHIKRTKIARYASNLKTTLRKAYGIDDLRKSNATIYPLKRSHQNRPAPWANAWPSYNEMEHHAPVRPIPPYLTNQRNENHTFTPNETIKHPLNSYESIEKKTEDRLKKEFKEKLLALFE